MLDPVDQSPILTPSTPGGIAMFLGTKGRRTAGTAKSRHVRPLIEGLEARQLLSASTTIARAARTPSTKIVAHPVAITSVEGAGFTLAHVATFIDGNGAASGADVATINWGDGSATDIGTILTNGTGGFIVGGSHTYAVFGNYKVKITVSNPDGRTASTTATAKVADAPLSAVGLSSTSTSGVAFTGAVATFTDSDGSSSDSESPPKPTHTAMINWGDGHTSPATMITEDANELFTVVGKHTYAQPGTYTLTTTIKDRGGAKATAAGGTMTVLPPVPVITPSLVGNFSGEVQAGGSGIIGIIAGLTGKQSFQLDITAQDIGSITAEVIIAGTSSGTVTLTGAELSNGNFHYATTDPNAPTITLSGHISADGNTLSKGFVNAGGNGFLSISGDWSAIRQS
jgi:PKD repeat protein